MSNRPAVKSAFENLRPTILREPARSPVSPEAAARLLDSPLPEPAVSPVEPLELSASSESVPSVPFSSMGLLQKKKRERLLLVSFRMPEGLKEKLEHAARKHEINQTDIINEAIELNLRRYL